MLFYREHEPSPLFSPTPCDGIYSDSDPIVMDPNYSNYFNINTEGWTGSLPGGGFQVVTMNSTTDLCLLAIASPAAVPEPGQVAPASCYSPASAVMCG